MGCLKMAEYDCCDDPDVGYEYGELICVNCNTTGVEPVHPKNVGLNWDMLAEAFDMPKEYLRYIQEGKADCDECGYNFDNVADAIEHDCQEGDEN